MNIKYEEWEILDRNELGIVQLFLVASIDANIWKENTIAYLMKPLAKLYKKILGLK